jgi:Ca2+-transporting ATPase
VCAATLASAVALVQTPPLASRLHLQPLHADEWGIAMAGGALACVPLWLRAPLRRRAR